MTKIEIIKSLDNKSLIALIKSLLGLIGFQNIRDERGCVRAEEHSALSEMRHVFVLPEEKLSGNVNIESITKLIDNAASTETFNVVTLVSNQHISTGFQSTLNSVYPSIRINYIGRDELITMINAHFPDYWRHDDSALVDYEHQYESLMENENQLKLLHLPSDKFKRLINIFIQPSLIEEVEDPQTHRLMRKRVDMKELINVGRSAVVSGQPGSGKTTLLYNIGLTLSKENQTLTKEKKNVPVFISAIDLINAMKDVKSIVLSKLSSLGDSLDDLTEKYEVILLVDSIDEFEPSQQKDVIRQLVNLSHRKIRFILTTRGEDRYQEYIERKDAAFYEISRFNTEQIRRFVNTFLPDEAKASDLLESLRENKILERLPITPLTLSLISILFDETDYEVPATVTDIYSKFNDLVVGRAIVSSKIEFIDVTFRERILSMYGYLLMEREEHKPLTYNEFISYFVEFYKGKSKQIKGGSLEEGLEYIVKNTGILYIKDGKYVCFSHDTYMEYYAAVEFFYFHRGDEQELVDKFFDLKWQNVAVFYAGITKDMDDFARSINAKLQTASRVMEYISGIQGAGYLLQALYLSDDIVRRDVILSALNLSLDTNEAFKKMATLPKTLFKNYRLPIVQALSLIHFYEMFNSLTLKTPLELSYDVLRSRYEGLVASDNYDKSIIPAIGYQLVCLAFTLDSKRIGNDEPLSFLIGQRLLLSDPNINSLLGISIEVLGKNRYKDLRDQVKKDYHSLKGVTKQLLDEASPKARFSALDTIHPYRRVKLFVEGRTDALILEHAYITLTHGQFPYWNVEMATQNGVTGSTHAVSKAIEAGINYSETYDYIIGIFDHDNAGLTAYNSLKKDYDEIDEGCIKRNKIKNNVFLLCIPIPGEMQQYLQTRQEFNFFEIEHYFGHKYLADKGLIKNEVLKGENVFDISDSKKTSFANSVLNEDAPVVFAQFVDLFKKIDKITGVDIYYDEGNVVTNKE
ncbi:MAG: NACHT domain-containing protein [Bacteroidales bacterium]|nr:NACHT domain-containing protein [Bacteroidales bacterium]